MSNILAVFLCEFKEISACYNQAINILTQNQVVLLLESLKSGTTRYFQQNHLHDFVNHVATVYQPAKEKNPNLMAKLLDKY